MSAIPYGRSVSAAMGFNLASGCVQNTKIAYEFDHGAIGKERLAQIDKECDYETLKALASASWEDPTGYRQEQLYITCRESKGGTFIRKYPVP